MTTEKERQKVLNMAQDRKEFVTDVDGFVYWWPTASPEAQGHLSAHQLRWIASELDRRNAAWQAQVDRDLAAQSQFVLQPGSWYQLQRLRGAPRKVKLMSLSTCGRYCVVRSDGDSKQYQCLAAALQP